MYECVSILFIVLLKEPIQAACLGTVLVRLSTTFRTYTIGIPSLTGCGHKKIKTQSVLLNKKYLYILSFCESSYFRTGCLYSLYSCFFQLLVYIFSEERQIFMFDTDLGDCIRHELHRTFAQ